MAQITAGIKLFFGDAAVSGSTITKPTTWTEIPDITSVPAMGAAPAKIETTTLAELRQKTYINGLMDLGGSFTFDAHMTPALVDAVNLAAADAASGKTRAFSIQFPAPLAMRYWWTGTILPVAPGDAKTDTAVSTMLYISQATALVEVDESGVS